MRGDFWVRDVVGFLGVNLGGYELVMSWGRELGIEVEFRGVGWDLGKIGFGFCRILKVVDVIV